MIIQQLRHVLNVETIDRTDYLTDVRSADMPKADDDHRTYFVWIQGPRGPTWQIWHGDKTVDQKKVKTLAKHPITLEDVQRYAPWQLVLKFPPPANEVAS